MSCVCAPDSEIRVGQRAQPLRERGSHAVSLKQETRVTPAGTIPRGSPRLAGKGVPRAGLLVVMAGTILIILAADDALAGVVIGGGDDDSLRGSGAGESLVGFGGGDETWGLAGDDALSSGGDDDALYGGTGHDALLGSAGDDFVEARDGERDYVWCGPGDDTVSVDPVDRVARNCETLYVG
jgi:Ca2+-binding RTX toxin-like protein